MMIKYLFFLSFPLLLLSGKQTTAQAWSWASEIGDTTGHTAIYAMHRYSDSEILIAGTYSSRTLKFGEASLVNNGNSDVLTALIDSTGNQLWALGFGGTGEEFATATTSDGYGNIYVVGNFSSLTMKAGTTTLINKGETDGFLVKINPQKEVEWAVGFGASSVDEITGVATDSEGNIYVSGHSIDYQNALFSVFITKFDASKNKIWERKGNTPGWNTRTTSLIVDDADDIYLAGSFSDVLTFDGKHKITSSIEGEEPYIYYAENAFIAKYSKSGDFMKATVIENFSKVNDITSHASHVYVCGEKINHGMGWGWPLSDSKIFTAKYNNNLDPVWEKTAGGETPFQSLDIAKAISADQEGNVYITGSFFSEKIDFGSDTLNNLLNKDYYYQMTFVLKYDSNGNEVWGKTMGDSLCDNGNAILSIGNDRFLLAGTYESNKIRFGNHTLQNNSEVKEMYVHLREPRQSRNMFSFVAMQNELGTGIKPISKKISVKIFPNPTSQSITISLTQDHTSGGEVTFFSHDGRMIRTQNIAPGEQQLKVDVENLRKGIYLVKVKTGNYVSVQKLVKE